MENLPSTSGTKKWKRPLTGEELLECLLNDDESVIFGLSDDEDNFGDIGDISDFHDVENDFELNDDVQEQEIIEENGQGESEEKENIEPKQPEGNNEQKNPEEAGINDAEETARNRKEFYELHGFTDKENIKWQSDVQYQQGQSNGSLLNPSTLTNYPLQ